MMVHRVTNSIQNWTTENSNRRVLCVLVILAVGLLAYFPSLKIGLWSDDYVSLDLAGRYSTLEYWSAYLSPFFYPFFRPMKGLQWWLPYILFRDNALVHHLIQIALYLATAVLLFDSIGRVTQRWRMSLIAVLIYMTLPTASLAVFWIGVADPVVGFFGLLTIWSWIRYLIAPSRWRLLLTGIAFVGALMSKEVAMFLPIIMFLIDRWIIRKPLTLNAAIRRYIWIVFVMLVYGVIELILVVRLVLTPQPQYNMERDLVQVLIQHLITLAMPWGLPTSLGYMWLVILVVGLGLAILRKAYGVVFVFVATLLVLLPVLQLPLGIAFEKRYLYLPLIGSSILFAVGIDGVLEIFKRLRASRWSILAVSLGFTGLISWNSLVVSEGAVNFEGVARQARMQIRSLFRQYPAFQPETLLYFINPPLESNVVSGLVFLNYGDRAYVKGNDDFSPIDFAKYDSIFVFYRDETNEWRKQMWDARATARVNSALPIRFGSSIALDTAQISANRIARGESIVLVLYWRGMQKMQTDYTVFVQIVDQTGKVVAGSDAQPRQGINPTSSWRIDQRIADAIVVPIDLAIAPGDYTIHVGLYDLNTMQRLSLVDSQGAPVADHIVIQPLTIQ